MSTQPGNSLRIPIFAACAGALGGLVPLVLQSPGLETKLFYVPWYGAISASLFLGAVAGIIGILLGNSDTSNDGQLLHTLVFALVCGIFWLPTIKGSSIYVQQAQAQYTARELRAKSQFLAASGAAKPTAGEDTVASQIADTASTARRLIEQIPNIGDADLAGPRISEGTAWRKMQNPFLVCSVQYGRLDLGPRNQF
jgi:hypothetical protein